MDSYCDLSMQTGMVDMLSNDNGYDSELRHREAEEYVDTFHPYYGGSISDQSEGATISILKKDGTWDLVQKFDWRVYDLTFNMDEWEFHYDEEEYARTVEGYLRVRLTTKDFENRQVHFKTKFFVLDYLPQKVGLSYEFVDTPSTITTRAAAEKKTVRIYFSNMEGISKLILERLFEGARLPGRITITDIKKGYYETTLDRNATFTAVGYNENGTSRGVPITIRVTN